jgi:hypothetical protein
MRISYDELVSAQKMGLSQDLIDKVEGHWSRLGARDRIGRNAT